MLSNRAIVPSTSASIWAYCGLLVLLPTLVGAQDTLDTRVLRSDPRSLLARMPDGGQSVVRTTIADLGNTDVREAPAHVQVITARQIRASGAKDLQEALQLVPGLSFGRDVDDVVGVGVHGNWAEEGKMLFMLNGSQLNENDFGTYALGRRIPLDNVERIEVISGPGSVIYGGYAALGVVNVVTRSADAGQGTQAVFQGGHANGAMSRTSMTVSGSHRLGRDQEISYLASQSIGQRSNAMALLPDSTLLSFLDSTRTRTSVFQFSYRWKTLRAYMVFMDETFGVSDASYSVQLRDVILGLEQHKDIGKSWELMWRVNHADQLPWTYINTTDPDRLATNSNNQRTSVLGLVSFKPNGWFSTKIGTQGFRQFSHFLTRYNDANFSMNGQRSIAMYDIALFSETSLHGKWGTLTGGYRFEYNDLTGRFAAPRMAYTRIMGRVHAKVLWSKAFKSPTIMNLHNGPVDGPIIPEYVTSSEAELGVAIAKHGRLVINAYETRVTDPIVYVYDEATLDNYINRSSSGTRGLDLRFHWENERLTLLAGAGVHRPVTGVELPEIQLPDSLAQAFQGLPNTRALLAVGYECGSGWSLNSRATWQSRIHSYQFVDAEGTLGLLAWPEQLVVDLGVEWRPRILARLTTRVGCSNLLDTERYILSPFSNATTPLLLNGRQYTFSLIYQFIQ